MTATVWPINSVSGAPTYAGRNLRQAQMGPSLAGATAARPLGAYSGVRPGTSLTTVTVTSSTAYSVAAFAGVIDAEAANEAGPYGFAFDAAQTGAIAAANASNPRVDILSVQISDPSESDGSTTPGVAVVATTGTAAATPVAPATPARSFVIAQINVPKSGGGNPTVTWVAPYSAGAGGIIPFPTRALMNTVTSFQVGQHAQVFADSTATNNAEYIWNGTIWAGNVSLMAQPSAVMVGAVPASGAPLLEQAGIATVTPTSGGDCTVALPAAFPNGVISAVLTRYDFSVASTTLVLNTTQTLSQVNFRVYQSSGAVYNAGPFKVAYVVKGW